MTTINTISLLNLSFAFIPVALTLVVFIRWSVPVKRSLHALARMLLQLLAVGYVLGYVFAAEQFSVLLAIILLMIIASGWISLSALPLHRKQLLTYAIFSISIGGGVCLLTAVFAVLQLNPWYQANVLIPLAGMVFASTITSISLAAERLLSEIEHQVPAQQAKFIAMQTAMIPVVNSLFAVGLVSLPGMMTGQILSGVSPLIAARYQIMIMCILFASSGLSSAMFLHLSSKKLTKT